MSTPAAELSELWRQVSKEVRELFKESFRELQLPRLSWTILRHIMNDPGMTVSDLARSIDTAKGHVSNLVDHLTKDGLIEKQVDGSDRRLVRLIATPKAEQTIDRFTKQADNTWETLLKEMPDEEWQEVSRALRLLLSALERTNASIGADTSA